MRVLHVISGVDSRAGGPAFAMAGLCKGQKQAGLDVAALATFRKGEWRDVADDLARSGVNVTLVGPVHGPLASHRHLPATLRAIIPSHDVVHVHGLWEDVQHQAARASRRLGKPYVVTPHGMLSHWSLRQKWLKKKLYMLVRLRRHLNGAAGVHYTSGAERDAAAALRLRPPAIVEPLGVDLTEFESLPAAGAFRARHRQLLGKPIVLFLGRIHPGKGLEYLVPAAGQAQARDFAIVVIGPDSEGHQAVIQRQAEQWGVQDRVLFTGMLHGRDRIEALRDADLFALPSEHENFGIVVVEALAAGTPVIVSDGVALHEEVRTAGVGAVVPARDAEALARELDRWLADGALRRGAAARARPFVWERFGWGKIAARWGEHYSRITRQGV